MLLGPFLSLLLRLQAVFQCLGVRQEFCVNDRGLIKESSLLD
jgi:hypothetical protein